MEKRCINLLRKHDMENLRKISAALSADLTDYQSQMRRTRVGIVGEILVKFLPDANNHLVELLEEEGREAV